MRRGRPLYRALGNLESVRGHVWGRDYVRDVPRGDVLDCKTERAGERMAEAPRRSIRKLDFHCADPRGHVAFPSLDLFNLPRFTAAAFFWTRDCVGELLLSRVIEARADCGSDGRSVLHRAIALDDGGL
jgi:hypothetical protein